MGFCDSSWPPERICRRPAALNVENDRPRPFIVAEVFQIRHFQHGLLLLADDTVKTYPLALARSIR
jgi:hypothetical protein